MTVDRWIDRLADETRLITHISRRELPMRVGMLVIFASLCLWLGHGIFALALVSGVALIELVTHRLDLRLAARRDAAAGLVLAIWVVKFISIPVYLSLTLVLVGTPNAAVVMVGLLWLFGVVVYISNSFTATPIYASVILVPTAVITLIAVWTVSGNAYLPAQMGERWLVLGALGLYAHTVYATLANQSDTRTALATARTQADARLRMLEAALAAHTEAERRFQDISAVSQDWFWEFDPGLRLRYLGNSFRRSTGFAPERFLGRSLTEVGMHDDGAIQGNWGELNRMIAARLAITGFVFSFLDRRPGRGRQRVWLRLTGTPYLCPQGNFAGYRGVCSNVTPFLAATERAEAANHAKSQFLAVMSHELRTPLTAVLGMAELLRAHTRDPEATGMIDTIRTSGEGLLTTLNDVLDLAKIEAGKMTVDLQPYDPRDLALRCQALFRPRAELAGLDLGVRIDPGLDGPRVGDANRILQVLNNLIGNAVKFTLQGGVRVIVAPDGPAGLALTVEDDGIGMTLAQQVRVFDEFEQAESSTSRRFGGTGLGLAITRQLVDLMGGTISVDSTPGQGSRFRVCLPAPRAAPGKPVTDLAPRPAVSVDALAGLRVLVADDNATNRRILDALLTRMGLRVTLVEDGRGAVAVYRPEEFDLILLDISMPELDGPSALAEIRKLDMAWNTTGPPVLAVTAHAMRHQIDEFMAAGFAGHVAKPFNRDSLVRAIGGQVRPGAAQAPRSVTRSASPGVATATLADAGSESAGPTAQVGTVGPKTGGPETAGPEIVGPVALGLETARPETAGPKAAGTVAERLANAG